MYKFEFKIYFYFYSPRDDVIYKHIYVLPLKITAKVGIKHQSINQSINPLKIDKLDNFIIYISPFCLVKFYEKKL